MTKGKKRRIIFIPIIVLAILSAVIVSILLYSFLTDSGVYKKVSAGDITVSTPLSWRKIETKNDELNVESPDGNFSAQVDTENLKEDETLEAEVESFLERMTSDVSDYDVGISPEPVQMGKYQGYYLTLTIQDPGENHILWGFLFEREKTAYHCFVDTRQSISEETESMAKRILSSVEIGECDE